MTLDILYLGVCLVAMIGQHPKCDATVTHTATSAMEIIAAHWFPEDIEFNESCVAEGCPDLKNILCPNDFEVEAARKVMEIINVCMRGTICGVSTNDRPLIPLVLSMEELLPGVDIDGNVTIVNEAGHMSNISNMILEIPSHDNKRFPFQMPLLIPNIRVFGGLQLDFRLETVFGPALTASLTQTTFEAGVEFISTMFVNKTMAGTKFDITFVKPLIRSRPVFCGIDMPSGFPDIQSMFTSKAQAIFEISSLPKALGKFLERIFQSAFQVVSKNCKTV